MSDFVIFTDSGCDVASDILREWGVKYCNLTFVFDDAETQYTTDDISYKEFYDKMRAGHGVKTAAVNKETFAEAFRAELQAGKDILYIGFSSALSATYNAGRLAAEELQPEFPERKIIALDTLCGSAGFGLMVFQAVQKKAAGATMEEIADYVMRNRLNVGHWFTVDDLVYLKRGGRISPAVAFFGSALGIKPILHMDNEGHLVSFSKVRGRKNAILAIADKYGETALDPQNNPVFITHGDCEKDAELLKNLLVERYGAKIGSVAFHGPTTGAHAGPGVLGAFYLAKER